MSNRRMGPRPVPDFPIRCRERTRIASLSIGVRACIAGRYLSGSDQGARLRDATGEVSVTFSLGSVVEPGDLVEVVGMPEASGGFIADVVRRLAPGREAPPPGSPNIRLWTMDRTLFDTRRRLRDRLRVFFLDRDFQEVESPLLTPAAGQEPYLDPFRTRLDDGSAMGAPRYLITSPEYFLNAASRRRLRADLRSGPGISKRAVGDERASSSGVLDGGMVPGLRFIP